MNATLIIRCNGCGVVVATETRESSDPNIRTNYTLANTCERCVDRPEMRQYWHWMLQSAKQQCEWQIDSMVAAAEALDGGVCPDCRKPIERRLDARQVGCDELPGVWFNYRCPCGFACDRKEDPAAPSGAQ
jgi:hypothetical protein